MAVPNTIEERDTMACQIWDEVFQTDPDDDEPTISVRDDKPEFCDFYVCDQSETNHILFTFVETP